MNTLQIWNAQAIMMVKNNKGERSSLRRVVEDLKENQWAKQLSVWTWKTHATI